MNPTLRALLTQARRYRPSVIAVLGSGLLLLVTPLGASFERFSYDAPFLFRHDRTREVALVYADETTLREAPVSGDRLLSRAVHAQVIERLKSLGARTIAYDFLFATTNVDVQADQALARAIRAASNVVLATTVRRVLEGTRTTTHEITPHPHFRQEARGWGVATFDLVEADRSVRRFTYHLQEGGQPTLAWVAATQGVAAASVAQWPRPGTVRWLNYLGPAETDVIPRYSFSQVIDPAGVPSGALSNRVVVVGPQGALNRGELSADGFANPYSRFSFGRVVYADSTALEIHATAVANLLESSWLSRIPFALELFLVLAWGTFLVLLYLQSRWRHATAIASGLSASLGASAILLVHLGGYWFAWCIPFVVQSLVAWMVFDWTNPLPIGPPVAFISYRRESGAEHARLIRNSLTDHRLRAFLDVADLGPDRYDIQLQSQIARTPNFLLIVGPGSLDRCRNPGDGVRAEIEGALAAKSRIIPILVDGFDWKHAPPLPSSLDLLPRLESIPYSHQEFDATMTRLRNFIRAPRRPGSGSPPGAVAA